MLSLRTRFCNFKPPTRRPRLVRPAFPPAADLRAPAPAPPAVPPTHAHSGPRRAVMDLWVLLPLFGTLIGPAIAEPSKNQEYDPFTYGRRCRCKFNQQQRTGEPDEEEGTLRSSIRQRGESATRRTPGPGIWRAERGRSEVRGFLPTPPASTHLSLSTGRSLPTWRAEKARARKTTQLRIFAQSSPPLARSLPGWLCRSRIARCYGSDPPRSSTMATPAAPNPDTNSHMDPFTYDYDTLRMVGLVLAIVMFVLGILIALSKKFRCKKSDPDLSDPRAAGKTPTPAGSA
ncbi:uncharacterized protein LOC128332825 [Hemicordylus capensis]|uniref:uncharacterized protein LOC128332825 n=1 Tax=Hemicordylus capensis TaxID=884348 RepID=UPI0023041BBF|nr:uncharacterized protein LOC128332825 [Hemicordylus capensis]